MKSALRVLPILMAALALSSCGLILKREVRSHSRLYQKISDGEVPTVNPRVIRARDKALEKKSPASAR